MPIAIAPSVILERPSLAREAEFIRCVHRSRSLHKNLVTPPDSPAAFQGYLGRLKGVANSGFFVCLPSSGELVGVINVNEIVMGNFKSAYLGYYAFMPHTGYGYMRAGLSMVLDHAFATIGLNRIEANIQPDNTPSLRLVDKLGFRKEGYSPHYLQISGMWRDHERWALLADEWR